MLFKKFHSRFWNINTNLLLFPRHPDTIEAVGRIAWEAIRPPMPRPILVKSEAMIFEKLLYFYFQALCCYFDFLSAMAACYKTYFINSSEVLRTFVIVRYRHCQYWQILTTGKQLYLYTKLISWKLILYRNVASIYNSKLEIYYINIV